MEVWAVFKTQRNQPDVLVGISIERQEMLALAGRRFCEAEADERYRVQPLRLQASLFGPALVKTNVDVE